jgi:predicted unusual protein kinase regulating ubiquinone biosynthesis (AarF/ABC1/UbiB family)
MENIKGLTINNIENLDSYVKEEFAKLFTKFGFISILYNSAIHNDLHAGNVFFYINDENSGLPKYQLGLIDFGLCTFPDKNNQNYYYIFFNEY